MWRVQPRRSVARSLARLPRFDRERVLRALEQMRADPLAGDVVKLKGQVGAFRRRVGDYRILFAVDANARTVDVIDVLRRTSTTY